MAEVPRRRAFAPFEADRERALLDPGGVFAAPHEVVARLDLTLRQRADILRSWLYDAAEIAVAEDEGMPVVETDLSHQILLALAQLGIVVDPERTSPTKQHGILSA